jgi:branched-chain amino acid transport system permease protein
LRQISLGHALYFGIGAYTTRLLFTKFGVSAVVRHARRRRDLRRHRDGARLSLLPPARTLLRHRHHRHRRDRALLFHNWDWAGAASGIDIPVRGDSWLKFQFPRSKLPYFYFALALACVAWFVTWWLEDSKWGYWWRAVKDNPDAAESLGVVVFNSKMGAAAVSAFLVAVGGSFYAQFVSYIDPESVMGFPVLAADGVARGAGRHRNVVGADAGRGDPDPADRTDALLHRRLRPRRRPDRLWRADHRDSLARPQGLVGLFAPKRKEAAR